MAAAASSGDLPDYFQYSVPRPPQEATENPRSSVISISVTDENQQLEKDHFSAPGGLRWKSGATYWPQPSSTDSETSPSSSDVPDTKRQPLRAIYTQNLDVPPIALATPFLPGISGGIWSPPTWKEPSPERTTASNIPSPALTDKDAEIRRLHDHVRRLSQEKEMAQNDNARLLGEVHHLSAMLSERNFRAPLHLGGISPAAEFQSIGLTVHDPHSISPPISTSASKQSPTGYAPSQITVDLILSGKLDYMRMDPRSEYDLIRPLVWTIAHQEPKNNTQATTLKIAANALGSRLSQPRSSPLTQFLVSVISEWAKPLCFTSNGNYLCQQLLEKGTIEDKINFISAIEDIVPIANSKFGAHVLVKAVGVQELEERIVNALASYGIYKSMQTGARKIWRPYLGKCRSANERQIFDNIISTMKGRWADLAVSNENGSISVQQIFEGCANQELIDACFKEIVEDISRVANNQYGHFVINKLLNFQEPMIKTVSHAILTAYPPLATNHHGVQFVEFVIGLNRILQRTTIAKYLEALCSQKDGRTPAIVAVANSSVGRGHLQTVLRQVSTHVVATDLKVPAVDRITMARVHNTCRQFQTTLRNSQSGNELLRSLGIINTPARR